MVPIASNENNTKRIPNFQDDGPCVKKDLLTKNECLTFKKEKSQEKLIVSSFSRFSSHSDPERTSSHRQYTCCAPCSLGIHAHLYALIPGYWWLSYLWSLCRWTEQRQADIFRISIGRDHRILCEINCRYYQFTKFLRDRWQMLMVPLGNLGFLSSVISFTQEPPHGSQESAPSEWNLLCAHPDMTGGGRRPWLIGCGIGIWPAIKFQILSSRTKHVLRKFRCVNRIARHCIHV